MPHNSPRLTTIRRAFEIIEFLWEWHSSSPSELAAQMDVSRSTVYDYLQTLQSMDYVIQTDGEYRLSLKPLAIGTRVKYRSQLFRVSRDELQRLATETGEVVSVHVEDNGRSVILHYDRGDQSLDLGVYPGMRTAIHSHAAGKTILAHLSEGYVEDIIDKHGLEAMTDKTVTSTATLKDELEQIRSDGYAVDWDQQVDGMGFIAAPILVDDELLGTVAIVTPTDRLKNGPYQEELRQKVREAANTISINYQYSQ
jgi:DNA-binding IclR family transcriptional regulator